MPAPSHAVPATFGGFVESYWRKFDNNHKLKLRYSSMSPKEQATFTTQLSHHLYQNLLAWAKNILGDTAFKNLKRGSKDELKLIAQALQQKPGAGYQAHPFLKNRDGAAPTRTPVDNLVDDVADEMGNEIVNQYQLSLKAKAELKSKPQPKPQPRSTNKIWPPKPGMM